MKLGRTFPPRNDERVPRDRETTNLSKILFVFRKDVRRFSWRNVVCVETPTVRVSLGGLPPTRLRRRFPFLLPTNRYLRYTDVYASPVISIIGTFRLPGARTCIRNFESSADNRVGRNVSSQTTRPPARASPFARRPLA